MKTEFTTPKGSHISVEFYGQDLIVIANGEHNLPVSKLERNTKAGPCLTGSGVTVHVPDTAVNDVENVINALLHTLRQKPHSPRRPHLRHRVRRSWKSSR